MKIAIIGAGWYGCHLASSFKALGFEVLVFEKSDQILSAASGNNQFRLHQGFHYARNHRTRLQSREGYSRFIERYAKLSLPISNNIYAVPEKDSLMDFLTYRMIMSATGLEFAEIDLGKYGIENCSGGLRVNERKLLIGRSRQFFNKRLESSLRLGQKISKINLYDDRVEVEGDYFDYVVDATWGALESLDKFVFFEPTVLFYYSSKDTEEFAFTAVDGPLCSIYPSEEEGVFTLSSVIHTPLNRFYSSEQAWSFLQTIPVKELDAKRVAMEKQVSQYYPRFMDEFEYLEPQLSVKTKISGANDDRSCYVSKKGRLFKVLSGKIDTIFMHQILLFLCLKQRMKWRVEVRYGYSFNWFYRFCWWEYR